MPSLALSLISSLLSLPPSPSQRDQGGIPIPMAMYLATARLMPLPLPVTTLPAPGAAIPRPRFPWPRAPQASRPPPRDAPVLELRSAGDPPATSHLPVGVSCFFVLQPRPRELPEAGAVILQHHHQQSAAPPPFCRRSTSLLRLRISSCCCSSPRLPWPSSCPCVSFRCLHRCVTGEAPAPLEVDVPCLGLLFTMTGRPQETSLSPPHTSGDLPRQGLGKSLDAPSDSSRPASSTSAPSSSSNQYDYTRCGFRPVPGGHNDAKYHNIDDHIDHQDRIRQVPFGFVKTLMYHYNR
ncbi:hypothetical protein TRIUR3_34240 [Triticum urartu]|uniref:Uncharacterized protein n=1 Tax=Triticum urartu TaxID=4572 RepID=M7YYN7_TRIUA|nr:hypothetical protein TRIUR3_34240 [Triticum urartu]